MPKPKEEEIYLREIAGTPPLTNEEERGLAQKMEKGDTTARDRLVKANLLFVVSVAKEYLGKGLPLSELICEGNVGVVEAARRFDWRRDIRFISYAVWWIRQAIRLAVCQQTRTIRLATSRIDILDRIYREQEGLKQELSRPPTREEIAEATSLDIRVIEGILVLSQNTLSLDSVSDNAPPNRNNQDLYYTVSVSGPPTDEGLLERSLSEDIEGALAGLEFREAEVLRLYFGLNRKERLTLEQIGGRYGVTRERARQIKNKALSRLRLAPHNRRLAPYLEQA
ncbi:RNA polymerase sigma factor RpoD/SigA [Candidatus Falkowbacteria bacterium]|nr:RNA polymerase sigma factor RpoD/SigA [Candidatus Falkowbacteria bacterium]